MNSKKNNGKKSKRAHLAPGGKPLSVQEAEEADERRRIRVLLKLPMLKRTHFLRARIGNGSAL